jgi:hypothetical protein
MTEPTFAEVFAEQWNALPPAMKLHYANRPFTRDRVTVEGRLTIRMGPLMKLMAPLMGALGMLTPRDGDNIACTVHFLSEPDNKVFVFERHFDFPGKPHVFRSRLIPRGAHDVTEYMPCGIGWRCGYYFRDGKVMLEHKGYVWHILGIDLPLLGLGELFMGRGGAFEEATGDDSFRMRMGTYGSLFGTAMDYAYEGEFRVTEMTLDR